MNHGVGVTPHKRLFTNRSTFDTTIYLLRRTIKNRIRRRARELFQTCIKLAKRLMRKKPQADWPPLRARNNPALLRFYHSRMQTMAGYTFRPITQENLPEIAEFLRLQQERTSSEDRTQARPAGDDLRWMLANPDLRADLPLGLSLMSPDGKLAGMILSVPRLYLLGDQRLLGLAAGDFFVDSSARMQGFFMLRRFLGLAGADFWYANSCNRQSGPLWAKCGAAMVPESDVEYLLPIRLGPLAQELAVRRAGRASSVRCSARLVPLRHRSWRVVPASIDLTSSTASTWSVWPESQPDAGTRAPPA